MAETSDKALHARWLLQAAIGVGFVGLAYLALRAPSRDERNVAAKSGGTARTAEPARAPPSSDPEQGVAAAGSSTSRSPPIASAGDMTQLLLEAKIVDSARASLAAGDPKRALKELELYEESTKAEALRQEATLLKIEALLLVGRKTDAHALARSTRSDPAFDTYQGRIATLLENDADAGR